MATSTTPTPAPKKKNFFQLIATGFQWIGKELANATEWFPKLFKVTEDVEADAPKLAQDVGQLIDDVGALAAAAVKDSGAAIGATETLISAVATAAASKALNIAADEGVVSAFKTWIEVVTSSSNYQDVLAAEKKLVVDYDALGAQVKDLVAQLKADA